MKTIDDAAPEPRGMSPVGEPFEETVAGGEHLRVQLLAADDARYAYVAECRYRACDGPLRDRHLSRESFEDRDEAMAAGRIKARQLAGIDVPEA